MWQCSRKLHGSKSDGKLTSTRPSAKQNRPDSMTWRPEELEYVVGHPSDYVHRLAIEFVIYITYMHSPSCPENASLLL